MYQEIIQLQTIGSMEKPTYQNLTLMVITIKFYNVYMPHDIEFLY